MAAPYLAQYGRSAQQGPANFNGTGKNPDEEEFRRVTPLVQPMGAGQRTPAATIPPPQGAQGQGQPPPGRGGALVPPPNMPQTPTGLSAGAAPQAQAMGKAPLVAPPGGMQLAGPQSNGTAQGQIQSFTGPKAAGEAAWNQVTGAIADSAGGKREGDTNADSGSVMTGNGQQNVNNGQGTQVNTPGGGQVNPGTDLRDRVGAINTPGGGNVRDDTRNAPQPPGANDVANDWQAKYDELERRMNEMRDRAQQTASQTSSNLSNLQNSVNVNMPDPTAGLKDMFGGAMQNVGGFNIGMFLNALGLGGLMGGGGGGGGGAGGAFGGFSGGGGGGSGGGAASAGGGGGGSSGGFSGPGGAGAAYQGGGQGGLGASSGAGSSFTPRPAWSGAAPQGGGALGQWQSGGTGQQSQNVAAGGTPMSQGGMTQGMNPQLPAGRGGLTTAAGGAQGMSLAPGAQLPVNRTPVPAPGAPTQGGIQGNTAARSPMSQALAQGGANISAQPQGMLSAGGGAIPPPAGGNFHQQLGIAGQSAAPEAGMQLGGPLTPQGGFGAVAGPGGIPPPGGMPSAGVGGGVSHPPGPAISARGGMAAQQGGQGGGASGPREGRGADTGGSGTSTNGGRVVESGGGGSGPREASTEEQDAANEDDRSQQNTNARWRGPPTPPGFGPDGQDPLSTLSDYMTRTDMARYKNNFDPFNTYNQEANAQLHSQVNDLGENNIRLGQRAEDAARQSLVGATTNERNAQQRMLDARAARGGMSTGGAQTAISQNAQNALQSGERQLAQDAYGREMGRVSALGQARGNLANSLSQGNQMDYENLLSQYTGNKESMNNLMGFFSSIGEILPF